MASPAAPAGLRPGRFYEFWFLGVLATLAISLGSITADFGTMVRLGRFPELPHVTSWAWWLYLTGQLANKAPVAYQYPYRGIRAFLEVAGFATGLLGVALLALGFSSGHETRLVLGSVTAAWLLTGVLVQLTQGRAEASIHRRVYCALVAFLIPSLPLLLAWLVRPAA